MQVKIAALNDEDARPLQRTISRAASRMHMHPHMLAMALMYWLEEVAGEVADGHPVRLMGFGAFFPYVYAREKTGLNTLVTPRFLASKTFRAEVGAMCAPGQVHDGNKQYDNYGRNHHISRDPDMLGRVVVPLEQVRQALRKEAAELGQDL